MFNDYEDFPSLARRAKKTKTYAHRLRCDMSFIAQYWWVWLTGLLIVFALAFLRSIMNLIELAKDARSISGKARVALSSPVEERRRRFTDLGIEIAYDKLKSRAINSAVTGVLLLIGGGFGVLLIVAIVHHVMLRTQ